MYNYVYTKSYFLSFLAKRLWKGLFLRIRNSLNFSSGDFSIVMFCFELSSILIDFGLSDFLGFVCDMNQTYFNNL